MEVAEFALAGGVRLLFSVLSGSDPSLIPDSGSNFVLKPLDLDDEIVGLADLALQRERPKLDVCNLRQDASDVAGYAPREYALV